MTPEEIKQWRTDTGFTQQRLADELMVSVITVCRWETGVRAIPAFLPLALEALGKRQKTGKPKKIKSERR
jgi:DNA-binding transcriptional regulator YiaG